MLACRPCPQQGLFIKRLERLVQFKTESEPHLGN
jgi:hypothetical protein